MSQAQATPAIAPLRAAIHRISQAFQREMPPLTLEERRALLVTARDGLTQQIAIIDKTQAQNGYVAPPTEAAKRETEVIGKGTRSSDGLV